MRNQAGYSTQFTKENERLLNNWKLASKILVLDPTFNSGETIEWSQLSRCFWTMCTEEYILADYYNEADVKKELVVKVFVAKAAGPPPRKFSTSGHSAAKDSKLHFGNIFFDNAGGSAIFFVIHPNAWRPYQYRFKTSSIIDVFNKATKEIVAFGSSEGIGAAIAAAAASGAAIGSFIPGPGTAADGTCSDDYTGDYLRYIG